MPRWFWIIWSLALIGTITWIAWPKEGAREGQVLAVLIAKEGNVQQRAAGSFEWTSAELDTPFLPLDSIATSKGAKATLRLQDGTELQLPEDTQLKLQQQVLASGVEVTLARGGLAVEAQTEGPLAPALAVKTPRYRIDLSNLKGSFRLGSDARVESSNPESVTISSPKQSTRLADLQEDGDVVLDASGAQTIIEIPESIAPELAVEPPEAPPPAAVVPAPQPKPNIEPPTLPPKKEEPPAVLQLSFEAEDVVLPEWKLKATQYWFAEPLREASELPIIVPAVWKAKDKAPWQTVFRLETKGSGRKPLLIKRDLAKEGFFFSLSEIQSLVPSSNIETIELQLQAGIMHRSDEGSVVRFAPRKQSISLRSLTVSRPTRILMDRWHQTPRDDQWFASDHARSAKLELQVFDFKWVPKLEPILRGARAFTLENLPADASTGVRIGFIKGPNLLLTSSSSSSQIVEDLRRLIVPDLVFKGESGDFLGGQGQFDLLTYLQQSSEVYYIRRGLALKLDPDLFKTQAEAREFIRRFNPYFFRKPVTILQAPSP